MAHMGRELGIILQGLFLVCLGALDYVFDLIFLLPSCVVVTPPCRTLVLAVQTEILASPTPGFLFRTLLASQSACETSYLCQRRSMADREQSSYRNAISCASWRPWATKACQ